LSRDRGLGTCRGEAALYSWICQIYRNALADCYRHNDRGTGRAELLEDQPNARAMLESLAAPPTAKPESSILRNQLYRIVETARPQGRDHGIAPDASARRRERMRLLWVGTAAALVLAVSLMMRWTPPVTQQEELARVARALAWRGTSTCRTQ
jgi:hypothetical protein